jgi:hypothetical protein
MGSEVRRANGIESAIRDAQRGASPMRCIVCLIRPGWRVMGTG